MSTLPTSNLRDSLLFRPSGTCVSHSRARNTHGRVPKTVEKLLKSTPRPTPRPTPRSTGVCRTTVLVRQSRPYLLSLSFIPPASVLTFPPFETPLPLLPSLP